MGDQIHAACKAYRKGRGKPGEAHPLDDGCFYFLDRESANTRYLLGHDSYRCDEHDLDFSGEPVESRPRDWEIEENRRFRYMMLAGCGPTARRYDRVTCWFHGLNERDFGQYAEWAHSAWLRDGTPSILFPLSFSIVRAHRDWLREVPETHARRRGIKGNDYHHPFNATISERLSTRPERLWWSAMQSYHDFLDLAREIRAGRHPFVAPDARIDLFGFSSGGFLALTLALENPESFFTESRVCLFATCVTMRDLIPSSRYILDRAAEDALRGLYVDHFDEHPNARLRHWLTHPEGRWLREWCGRKPDLSRTWARLREIAPRVLGIANRNDQVFPYGAMLNALQGVERDTGVRVEVLDLGIHERPMGSPDYNQRDAHFVNTTLNEELYGDPYRRFINLIVEHLSGRPGQAAGAEAA